MRIDLKNMTIALSWEYKPSTLKLALVDTICKISLVQKDGPQKEVIRGVASCSLTDSYRKETGRKLSFQRAVLTKVPDPDQKMGWRYFFEEEDRKRIYRAYFTSRKLEVPKELELVS